LRKSGIVVDENRRTKPLEMEEQAMKNSRIKRLEDGMRGVLEGFVSLSEKNESFYDDVAQGELTRLCETGEMEVIASELGVSTNEAHRQVGHALYAPLQERKHKAEERKRVRWEEVDDAWLDEKTQDYAREHSLSYGDALTEFSGKIYRGERI
jgi:hypothetical protein